jgi:hypothetical protein
MVSDHALTVYLVSDDVLRVIILIRYMKSILESAIYLRFSRKLKQTLKSSLFSLVLKVLNPQGVYSSYLLHGN